MIVPIVPHDPQHHRYVAEIWTQASGNCFTISPNFVEYNLDAPPGLRQQGHFAIDSIGTPVGFAIASYLSDDPLASPRTHGWIDAIAVLPEHQEQGYGSKLLEREEAWLLDSGCTEASLGASIRTFTPGLPPDTLSMPFFHHRGYAGRPAQSPDRTWDVAIDLAAYETPVTVGEIDGHVGPGTPGDDTALRSFLHREFPGRWRYETEEYLDRTGRITDFMLLRTERGIDGFCWLTFEDSGRPIERYYPYGLPRPWGQLGPIGVSSDRRGRGYGAAVLDAGLRRLQDNGVRGCVIDWTNLLDFYGKFGFSRYREYVPMIKKLA